jgi:putative addiction module component (TIGR02574 family)
MAAVLPYEALLESSLSLPPQERSSLATRLIESLDEADDDLEISPAWRKELDRRVEAVRNGTMRTIPHEEVMRDMRALLDDIQDGKNAS